jgi:hypothetical protein
MDYHNQLPKCFDSPSVAKTTLYTFLHALDYQILHIYFPHSSWLKNLIFNGFSFMVGHQIHPLTNHSSHRSTHSGWYFLLVDSLSPFDQWSFLVDPILPHFDQVSFWSGLDILVESTWSN